MTSPPARTGALLGRPAFLILAALVVLALAGAAVFLARRNVRERWARQVAIPEFAKLIEAEDFVPAMRLARKTEEAIPGDPELRRLVENATLPFSVETQPAGAEVSYASYLHPGSGWERLGISPLPGPPVPIGALRWRVERKGFETLETAPPGERGAGGALFGLRFVLTPEGAGVPGMVRVPGGEFQYRFLPPARLPDFWLDKYEVTNRRFKEFVDKGGYTRTELWRHPFERAGREISREEAMRSLRDPTGRPGPATWELGTYPAGREDFPVSGVSWYEAAAYCESVGKSLPTMHHFYRAADLTAFSQIVRLSNFEGESSARVGTHSGLGPYGTYDMAGNVKEWSWNASATGRYINGGAWTDPSYIYGNPENAPPMQRTPEFGLRCARSTAPLPAEATAPVEPKYRDYSKEQPAPDEVFRVYSGLYSYERGDLAPRVESVDGSPEHWNVETVSFNAAYGGERVLARLFVPKNAVPPYQTVVYFSDSSAEQLRSSKNINTRQFDFLMRSGRAVMLPIYKGTYERLGAPVNSPTARRDLVILWSKDLGRSIDYLQSRRNIDASKIAYYGFSLGAVWGPVLGALEPRLNAAIWLGGGFPSRNFPPESDPIHFAPRVKIPVLMVNGRQDFMRPMEISQTPLLRLLGTPQKDKRHAVIEGGHLPPRMQEVIREVLDWLDRHLGPIRLKA